MLKRPDLFQGFLLGSPMVEVDPASAGSFVVSESAVMAMERLCDSLSPEF